MYTLSFAAGFAVACCIFMLLSAPSVASNTLYAHRRQANNHYDFSLDPAAAMVPSILSQPQPKAANNAAVVAANKANSSFVLSDSQLIGNTAMGAGGAVFATSSEGVYLLCNTLNNGGPSTTHKYSDSSCFRLICVVCVCSLFTDSLYTLAL